MAAVSPRAEASPVRLRSGRLARAAGWLSQEALLVGVFATVATIWSLDLGGSLRADSWLTLLGGREILAHGLPRHDTLAIVSRGRSWIDQQWLSQLGFYGLDRLGGIGAVVRANAILYLAPLWVSLLAARRRGASPARVVVVALPAFLLTETFVRAQVLSQLLFVALFLLLVAESRRPSRRVLLVVPLLVVWANLHGAVVVGAALTALLGAVELVRGRGRSLFRPAALLVVPWLCVFATPYGFSVAGYYSSTIGNPLLAKYITEWASPTFPSAWGVPFFGLAFLAACLVARRPRRLNAFELLALGLTLVGGLLAIRSIVWFVYVCTILLPALLEDVWPAPATAAPTPRERTVRVGAALACLALFVVVWARPVAPDTERWPAQASATVAAALRQDPQATVLANDEYADWLLWRVPSSRGRIAFDGRWEILSRRQFEAAMRFLHQDGPGWAGIARGYRVLVLDPGKEKRLVATYAARRDWRVLFRAKKVVVLERTRGL